MNEFSQFRARCNRDICARITARIAELSPVVNEYGHHHVDTLRRLEEYALRGKMIRGSLVLLAYKGYCPESREDAILDAAAAMELLQSMLLIHDDIMDQDNLRRGLPSIHARYKANAPTLSAADATHYGNSMAICCGDIAFAIANLLLEYALEHIAGLSADSALRIRALYNHEIIRVGMAQMDDVAFSSSAQEPRPEEVLTLYRNKTGFYSIVLPLTLGALSANEREDLPLLTTIGVSLGEIFQIRDDLLGIVPAAAENTKSIKSDILNGKKTYIRQLLVAQNNPEYSRRLRALEAGASEEKELLSRYHALLHQSGVLDVIATTIEERYNTTLATIEKLQRCSPEGKTLLRQFSAYNTTRTV